VTLNELAIQCHEDVEKWFPDLAWNLPHQALGLCGEAGELANLVKKLSEVQSPSPRSRTR